MSTGDGEDDWADTERPARHFTPPKDTVSLAALIPRSDTVFEQETKIDDETRDVIIKKILSRVEKLHIETDIIVTGVENNSKDLSSLKNKHQVLKSDLSALHLKVDALETKVSEVAQEQALIKKMLIKLLTHSNLEIPDET